MKKNNKKNNTLIKRKNLILRLKKAGLERLNPDSVLFLEEYFDENLDKMINSLKEEVIIQGRKTLRKKDVQNVLKKIKKEDIFWEV